MAGRTLVRALILVCLVGLTVGSTLRSSRTSPQLAVKNCHAKRFPQALLKTKNASDRAMAISLYNKSHPVAADPESLTGTCNTRVVTKVKVNGEVEDTDETTNLECGGDLGCVWIFDDAPDRVELCKAGQYVDNEFIGDGRENTHNPYLSGCCLHETNIPGDADERARYIEIAQERAQGTSIKDSKYTAPQGSGEGAKRADESGDPALATEQHDGDTCLQGIPADDENAIMTACSEVVRKLCATPDAHRHAFKQDEGCYEIDCSVSSNEHHKVLNVYHHADTDCQASDEVAKEFEAEGLAERVWGGIKCQAIHNSRSKNSAKQQLCSTVVSGLKAAKRSAEMAVSSGPGDEAAEVPEHASEKDAQEPVNTPGDADEEIESAAANSAKDLQSLEDVGKPR